MHFVIYAAIGLVIWGAYHKIFVAPTNKIEKQVNVYSGDEGSKVPLFGCAAWRINNQVYWKKAVPMNNLKEVK